MPEITTIDADGSRLSRTIPPDVKIAFADALMAFAAMEVSAETMIWDLAGMNWDDGRLLTRMDAKPKFELAKKLSERYQLSPHKHPKTVKEFWKLITEITENRNKIAHGIWLMLDGTLPIAASYRLPADLGRSTGEAFPVQRLNDFADACNRIKGAFEAMAAHHLASPAKPVPPPSKQTSSSTQSRSKKK